MKTVLVIGDGMADFPLSCLGGETPLFVAKKPMIDALAMRGIVGEVRTVPKGVPAGSDTAILSIFGYDPRQVYTGRSPLEAAGSGAQLVAGNISFRCNLTAVSEDGGALWGQTMLSHSGGAIEGQEAITLMNALLADDAFCTLLARYGMRFTINPSYRHIAVLDAGSDKVMTTPPHDILTRCIENHLPVGDGQEMLREIMESSYHFLNAHPLNLERVRQGKPKANLLWFWGQGSAVELASFTKKYGYTGDVITAVPLVAGIAELAGLQHTPVEGATGELDTNYAGKVDAVLSALHVHNFAAVHIEAPDECGHAGDAHLKVEAIERIDSEIFAPLLAGLDQLRTRYRILFVADHYTPVSTRTHDDTPVPFLLYDSGVDTGRCLPYNEKAAVLGGRMEEGTHLMPLLFGLDA